MSQNFSSKQTRDKKVPHVIYEEECYKPYNTSCYGFSRLFDSDL